MNGIPVMETDPSCVFLHQEDDGAENDERGWWFVVEAEFDLRTFSFRLRGW